MQWCQISNSDVINDQRPEFTQALQTQFDYASEKQFASHQKKNPIESAKLRDLHEEQPQCDGNKQESEEEFDRRGSHFPRECAGKKLIRESNFGRVW